MAYRDHNQHHHHRHHYHHHQLILMIYYIYRILPYHSHQSQLSSTQGLSLSSKQKVSNPSNSRQRRIVSSADITPWLDAHHLPREHSHIMNWHCVIMIISAFLVSSAASAPVAGSAEAPTPVVSTPTPVITHSPNAMKARDDTHLEKSGHPITSQLQSLPTSPVLDATSEGNKGKDSGLPGRPKRNNVAPFILKRNPPFPYPRAGPTESPLIDTNRAPRDLSHILDIDLLNIKAANSHSGRR